MNELYISVDIETSGPIPGEFSMLSLGACVVGRTSDTFYAELKPVSDNYVQEAINACRLSIEDLKLKGTPPAEAMKRFESWIKEVTKPFTRPVFVAFNATFDWMFVHYYFHKYLGRDPFGISGLDMKAYYMGMTNSSWRQTTKRKIDPAFLSKKVHTHNALDDAVEQAEIFQKMLVFNREKSLRK